MSASDFQLLVSDDWSDYQLLDSGDLRKLERFGKVRVNRPDPQAFWRPKTPVENWKADAVFPPRPTMTIAAPGLFRASNRPRTGPSAGTA